MGTKLDVHVHIDNETDIHARRLGRDIAYIEIDNVTLYLESSDDVIRLSQAVTSASLILRDIEARKAKA